MSVVIETIINDYNKITKSEVIVAFNINVNNKNTQENGQFSCTIHDPVKPK